MKEGGIMDAVVGMLCLVFFMVMLFLILELSHP